MLIYKFSPRALFVAVLALGASFVLFYDKWTPRLRVQAPANDDELLSFPFNWDKVNPDVKLKWVPCYELYMQCARLKVPLDYNNPHGGSAAIALIRIPSPLTGTPAYRGPILFNPGGPGGSGVEFIRKTGAYLSVVVGPTFDLVGFDPRGIRYTTPRVSFFKTDPERAQWWLKDTFIHNSTSTSLPDFWALSQIIGGLAEQRDDGALKHVTTDVVAQDMLRIVQAHGRDKINYWGLSYGTILGATFATMFPNNVNRLIIDGVVDSDDYYQTKWTGNLRDTDNVLETFFIECVSAGPRGCPFYAPTPGAISRKLDHLFQLLKENPLPVQVKDLYGVVDYPMLKTLIFVCLYQPYGTFPMLAKALSELEKGDGRGVFQFSTMLGLSGTRRFECACSDPANSMSDNTFEIQTAVICTDGAVVPNSLDDARHYFEALARQSTWAEVWARIRLTCLGWRSRAKNHFSGPHGANTSFPLLIIGNTADPVTPLWAARRTAQKFPSSVVLTQDSPGHCSLSGPSLCTPKHIRRYLEHGILPPAGTVCPVHGEMFPSIPGIPKDTSAQETLDVGDRNLLDAVEALSGSFESPVGRLLF